MTHLNKLLALVLVCLTLIPASHAQAQKDWAKNARGVFHEEIQAGKLTQEQATTYLVCTVETMRGYNSTEPVVRDFYMKSATWMRSAVSEGETRPSASETKKMVSELNQMVPEINAYMDKAEALCRKKTGIPAEPGKALRRLNKLKE